MYLINTTTHELKSFLIEKEERPTSEGVRKKFEYAILSHRWEEDEMTFRQMQDLHHLEATSRRPAGWEKIEKFCDLAASRNVSWAWADTCCIDKSSSAELSEAINSMYKYYKDAKLCVVYMNDVSRVDDDSFHRSRWFTRGWTLQELIAPVSSEFYNKEWSFLGTRSELSGEIWEITGIPRTVLFDPELYQVDWYSVAERMWWASDRKTTREEDIAYCLLGLFDVNMPLLYGEGANKAFRRLQIEIISRVDDETIFAHGFYTYGRDRSLLADHPRQFKSSIGVKVIQNLDQLLKPFYVTNKGIHFERNLFQASVEEISELDVDYSSHQDSIWFSRMSHHIFTMPVHCTEDGLQCALILLSTPQNLDVFCCIGKTYFQPRARIHVKRQIIVTFETAFRNFFGPQDEISILRKDLVKSMVTYDSSTSPALSHFELEPMDGSYNSGKLVCRSKVFDASEEKMQDLEEFLQSRGFSREARDYWVDRARYLCEYMR